MHTGSDVRSTHIARRPLTPEERHRLDREELATLRVLVNDYLAQIHDLRRLVREQQRRLAAAARW